jgi:hypothetical protein
MAEPTKPAGHKPDALTSEPAAWNREEGEAKREKKQMCGEADLKTEKERGPKLVVAFFSFAAGNGGRHRRRGREEERKSS